MPPPKGKGVKQGHMTKAKPESVAEIIARKKAESTRKNDSTPKIKTQTEKKPATKKAGFVGGKKEKKKAPIVAKKKHHTKKPKCVLDNMRKPDIYLEFISFHATLPNFKTIQTQAEFAKEFGVDEGTLSDWKKRDGFWDSVRDERRTMMKERMVPKIIMAVYNKTLKEGSSKEAKLLLELSGEYEERKVIENNVRELPPGRKEEISKRVKMWNESLDDDDDDEDKDKND